MHALSLLRLWVSRRTNDTGASLVEYALLVSLIAVVALVAVTTLGADVNGQFQNFSDALND
jgi:Flp pilus assembly pilin Flp